MSELMEKIRSAYERDQQRKGRPVRRADELPVCYEDISDDWLTDVLCHSTPGAKVIRHRLGPTDSGSSNRRRIAVDYNAAGQAAGLPTMFFCKASHGLANRVVLGMSSGAYVETTFYADIRPLLNIEAPQAHYSRFDAETFNSLILLDDLTDEVTEFCSHLTRMTRARAESQMRLLATAHGTCYRDPRARAQLESLGTWPEYFQRTLGFGMEQGSNNGFKAAQEVIPPPIYRRFDEIWPATLASVERHNHLPLTLAHGDVHLKNWYVAGNGEMGLGDWQCLSRGHWGRDVAYAMSTALATDDRRNWERELLALYLDQLRAAGGPTVSFDEAWMHYRQQLMTALAWWTITLTPTPDLPDMQPRDITLEFIRRIAQTMEDVDTLGSFD